MPEWCPPRQVRQAMNIANGGLNANAVKHRQYITDNCLTLHCGWYVWGLHCIMPGCELDRGESAEGGCPWGPGLGSRVGSRPSRNSACPQSISWRHYVSSPLAVTMCADPRCDAAFFDFSACCALACSNPECGKQFCAWCQCQQPNSQACHKHVTTCPVGFHWSKKKRNGDPEDLRQSPGSYFAEREAW